MSQHRKQTTGEEIANAVSHGIMGLFGLIALILLLIESTTIREYAGAILFGGSIMLLYIMSTLYHSLTNNKAKSVFKRIDHISIYVLIGGTFAPALLLIPQLQEPFIGQCGSPHWPFVISPSPVPTSRSGIRASTIASTKSRCARSYKMAPVHSGLRPKKV